jgi:hypothetical protein
MEKYTVTMTRSPDLSDDEVRHRLAQVYALLIELGRQANGDAPAESTRTGAGASDGTAPVADRPQHHTTLLGQAQVQAESIGEATP